MGITNRNIERDKLNDSSWRWDLIREVMGKCPLYQGVIWERDCGKVEIAPRINRITAKKHRCPYCNPNRDGKHQDFCPTAN